MNILIIDHPRQPVPMPDESARGAILLGLGVLAAFFVGLGGWAAYAPLNGAAIAPAVIKVEGNRKTIQHLDGGIVKELLIKDGARVELGQTLIVLDETQTRAARDVLAQQFDVLRGEEARLLAERAVVTISPANPCSRAARAIEPPIRPKPISAIRLNDGAAFTCAP